MRTRAQVGASLDLFLAAGDGQGFLVNPDAVGFDVALDHAFTQAVRGRDEHAAPIAGDRVQGHHHAGGCCVNHPLNHNRHRQIVAPDSDATPVGDGLRGEQAAPTPHDVGNDRVDTADPEIGVLLSCKRCVGEVFGCRAGPHRDNGLTGWIELEVGVADRRGNIGRNVDSLDQCAQCCRRLRVVVRGIGGDRGADGVPHGGDRGAVRGSCYRKTIRDRQVLAEQRTETDRFAAHGVAEFGGAGGEREDKM